MSRAPIIRMISWPATAVNVLVLASLLVVGWIWFGSPTGECLAFGIYLAYAIGSRRWISRDHRQGVRLVRMQRYAEAIEPFRKSLEFFDRFPWIDRYRALLMLSPSALGYREMAMCNLAFCFAQCGKGADAQSIYRAVLQDYPENRIAQTALKMIEIGQQLESEI